MSLPYAMRNPDHPARESLDDPAGTVPEESLDESLEPLLHRLDESVRAFTQERPLLALGGALLGGYLLGRLLAGSRR